MAPSRSAAAISTHRQRPLRIRASATEAAAGNTAAQAMKDARTELGRIVRNKLVEATGREKACMHWNTSSYERVIVGKHHLELYGWPADVELRDPGKMSLRVLHELIRAWRAGRIGFQGVPGAPAADAPVRRRKRVEGERKPRRANKVKSPEFVLDSDEEPED